MNDQLDAFPSRPVYPEGFFYQPELISTEEERELVERISALPFQEFRFQEYVGRRRVISFGWGYDFEENRLKPGEPIPELLLPALERAAGFAGVAVAEIPHVLVTEYGPGAAIGWHRDRAVFDKIIGLSLLSACTFRLRRRAGDRWERVSLEAHPRSAYVLSGPARTDWEHSIPPVPTTRYSITFRTLRKSRRR